ncbi:MAG: Rhodanese domain protein [Deltaproteobacteria bacterium]|nr:Rhodanese domain protein [Deltaproteobacteria bacterium]
MAVQQITPGQAYRLLGSGHRYIDVRTEAEFVAGHPLGAVNIPLALLDPHTRRMTFNPDFLRVVEVHFAKTAPIIVGCQSGGRSQQAAELLQQAGYTTLANMQGGFGGARDAAGREVAAGWAQSGLPLCTECGAQDAYATLRRALS